MNDLDDWTRLPFYEWSLVLMLVFMHRMDIDQVKDLDIPCYHRQRKFQKSI